MHADALVCAIDFNAPRWDLHDCFRRSSFEESLASSSYRVAVFRHYGCGQAGCLCARHVLGSANIAVQPRVGEIALEQLRAIAFLLDRHGVFCRALYLPLGRERPGSAAISMFYVWLGAQQRHHGLWAVAFIGSDPVLCSVSDLDTFSPRSLQHGIFRIAREIWPLVYVQVRLDSQACGTLVQYLHACCNCKVRSFDPAFSSAGRARCMTAASGTLARLGPWLRLL